MNRRLSKMINPGTIFAAPDKGIMVREICELWPDNVEVHTLAHNLAEHPNDYGIRQLYTVVVRQGGVPGLVDPNWSTPCPTNHNLA